MMQLYLVKSWARCCICAAIIDDGKAAIRHEETGRVLCDSCIEGISEVCADMADVIAEGPKGGGRES